ncbi:protein ALWAYS EARLY 3-like isoform X1 [Punica granatum]|uniref:Protein ALWAYS EARLY 3-like isoform X1 n=1 Tax=Punica granatum TaxID=22663 RepID=A0A6P8DR23_PUNGR|nr:protein ALWAYS EARLY 3-like isoform X1 [Punica granatum]
MAPSRKSRSINRRIPFANEVPWEKAEGDANKNCQRKRKLSDMLGPEWSKEELEGFYEAYRKYGKDWKKVAAAIRYRSAEMVEALFSMNRAYLSLPEGTASVVGLVAMMTDHYAMMGRSDNEQDSSDGEGASRKPQKCTRAKLLQNNSKKIDRNLPDLQKLNSDVPSDGCLSLLKKRRSGSETPVVGRRTPRIPVSYSHDRDFGARLCSPNKQAFKQKINANDDYDVAHEVAVALTEASQRGGSPNLSQTPKGKSAKAKASPIRNGNGMHAGSQSSSAKPHDSEFEGGCELSLGSSEGTGIVVLNKGKKQPKKMLEVKESAHYDDIKEACSGTEEGERGNVFKKKLENRVSRTKNARSPSKGLRKKSKKILFGEDRDSTFDALQTLADLSLMMPASTVDSNLPVQIKEEREKTDTVEQSKRKGNLSVPTEFNCPGTSETIKAIGCETNAVDELKEEVHSNAGIPKRKQRSSPFRIPKANASLDSRRTDSQKIEASKTKGESSSQHTSQSRQQKMKKTPECTTSSTDLKMDSNEVHSTSVMNFNKVKRRSNPGLKKNSQRDNKFLENFKRDQLKISTHWFHDTEVNPKEKLHHFLSKYQARRWCIFEWFYSAIDYPWFARREFAEYLDHVGLGHVPCLTRVEWGVIRSSLGKPRRFSKHFLEEEREKLVQHRKTVRKHHTSFRSGTLEVLPSDLPQPLFTGQRVIVIHPKSREIHGGYVLTVEHSSCLIQFEQLELGIHWVKDIDCMPLTLLENIPESPARSIHTSKKLNENSSGPCLSAQMKNLMMDQSLELPTTKRQDEMNGLSHSTTSTVEIIKTSKLPEGGSSDCNLQVTLGLSHSENATLLQASNSQASDSEQIQAREADILALSELTRALDKKEAVLLELRRMNDEVSEYQKDGVDCLKDSEPFTKTYAATLLQLNDLNQQVSSALCCLRQRNSYQENVHPKPATTLVDPCIQLSSIDFSCRRGDFGPRVSHIIESSRTKAREMVVAALQAASSLFKDAKGLDGFEEAVDFVNNQLAAQDFLLSNSVLINSESQDQMAASRSPNPGASHGPVLKLTDSLDENSRKIPSELIASCVATLLIIQNCTERQFPPAEVAQIIDSAVKSLKPLCSQNLPIYTEIQKCMGMIRNQILGLIPTS